jgi:hypothetical protein
VLHNVIHLVFGDTFGLVSIGGHDIWVHGVIGVLLTFVGFGWARGVARA